jgi:hypothetical protein
MLLTKNLASINPFFFFAFKFSFCCCESSRDFCLCKENNFFNLNLDLAIYQNFSSFDCHIIKEKDMDNELSRALTKSELASFDKLKTKWKELPAEVNEPTQNGFLIDFY